MDGNTQQTLTNNLRAFCGAIGINNDIATRIIENLGGFNQAEQLRLITISNDALQSLNRADDDLNAALNQALVGLNEEDRTLMTTNINTMKFQLVHLQGLILLKKVQTRDCNGAINAILNAVTRKTTAINQILRTELNGVEPDQLHQAGGGDDDLRYRAKYLKYKAKYLNLSQK